MPMRRGLLPLLLVLGLVALVGCGSHQTGSGVATPTGTSLGPHGSNAVPLPNGAGFAEMLSENAPGGGDPLLVAYFYKSDMKTPLSPLPTDLKVIVGGAEFPFKAPAAAAEGAAAKHVTSSGVPVDPDRIAGELAGTVGGQAFRIPFTVGQ